MVPRPSLKKSEWCIPLRVSSAQRNEYCLPHLETLSNDWRGMVAILEHLWSPSRRPTKLLELWWVRQTLQCHNGPIRQTRRDRRPIRGLKPRSTTCDILLQSMEGMNCTEKPCIMAKKEPSRWQSHLKRVIATFIHWSKQTTRLRNQSNIHPMYCICYLLFLRSKRK